MHQSNVTIHQSARKLRLRYRSERFAWQVAVQSTQRAVQKLEEMLPVELDADLGVWSLAGHAVVVADGLAAGEAAFALYVHPHRAHLQESRLQNGGDGDGVVQGWGVEAE